MSLADLSKERWAFAPSVLPSYQHLRQVLEQHTLSVPQIAFESRSPLAILPATELSWLRPIGAIVRSEGYLPPAVQRLIDILKSELHFQQKHD